MLFRSLALIGAFVASSFATAADGAAAAQWKEGTHYFKVEPAVPSDAPAGKVEVTEVFSYGCPACNLYNPLMQQVRKALPANAVMTYVPASFKPNEDWPMFQRAYYAAQALGIAEKTHDEMFNAVWRPKAPLSIMNEDGRTVKNPLPTIEDAAKWYAQHGVKAEDFVATANSFAINAKMKRADNYLRATGTDSTPTLIVAGKYRLTPASAGEQDKVVPLVQYLIQLETAH